MSLPPAFTESFFRRLAAYAKEFRISRVNFALKAIDRYAEELRKKRSIPVKALGGVDVADQYSQMVSKVSKSWWAKQSPEERAARAKKAAEGRWSKKKEEK
jgi:hypothetical protein